MEYEKLLKSLQKSEICQKTHRLKNENIVSLRVQKNQQSVIKHSLSGSNQKIYILVEQGATCTLQSMDLMFKDVAEQAEIEFNIVVEQEAQLKMFLSYFQVLSLLCSVNIYLQSDNAQADIKGLYALSDNQNIVIQTNQYHQGVDSTSNLVIKGMVKDRSKVSYQGLIKIGQTAINTDASLENKNIVLGKDAKIVSVPSIEVLQHDVQCCHGSAIGKFDQEHMWYLQSKGLTSVQAYTLLIRSFFQDVLIGTEHDDQLLEMLCKKMI